LRERNRGTGLQAGRRAARGAPDELRSRSVLSDVGASRALGGLRPPPGLEAGATIQAGAARSVAL